MANLKNITDLPVAESAEGLNLIVNDNGSAKQIAASAVGAQADWAVTDENSPAFIKNKPVEEWDLDLTIITTIPDGFDPSNVDYNENTVFAANDTYSYDAFTAKLKNGDTLKTRVCWRFDVTDTIDIYYPVHVYEIYKSIELDEEFFYIIPMNMMMGEYWWIILEPDGSFCFE